jgi:hypothetical protein
MTTVSAQAFLSYANLDNEREGGRIVRMRDLLRGEYEMLTGETIEIFVDRTNIGWGDDWRTEIESALEATTFFIPILTPTYFSRDECRREMRQFIQAAKARELSKMLLSIRYVPVLDLVEGSSDELKAEVARIQYESWHEVRLADESSSEYRQAINRLASRLVELSRAVEPSPQGILSSGGAHGPGLPPARSDDVHGDDAARADGVRDDVDDAPGAMEYLADFQPAMEKWAETLRRFPVVMEPITEIFQDGGAKLSSADKQSNPAAARLTITKKMASELREPVADLEQMSKDYVADLTRLDEILTFLMPMYREHQGTTEDYKRASDTIHQLSRASKTAMEQVQGAANTARQYLNLSRDLRPLLRRFEASLRNIIDAQGIIDAWPALFEEPALLENGGREA